MNYLNVFISGLILFLFPAAGIAGRSPQSGIVEKPMRAELIWSVGSDEKNEDFFNPRSFAIDTKGRIFVLDTGNSRVQCFSPEGKFLFSFGRRGQGPGELSKEAAKIRILEDGNIYIIDNRQRRINVHDSNGNFLRQGKTPVEFDDIVLIDGIYYYSNLILKEDHLPVHLSKTLGNIDKSFGILIDPDKDLLKRAVQLDMADVVAHAFSSQASNLLVNSKKEIIFSPFSPYRLIKFGTDGKILRDLEGKTDFYTGCRTFLKLDSKKGIASIGSQFPMARLFQPYLMDNDRLVYFYLNPEEDTAFFDLYDSELNLVSRYKMQNTFMDYRSDNNRPKEYFGYTYIDRQNNLYAFLLSQEDPPRLVKYKLIY